MARLIESFDWSRSPLGPLPQWPLCLKTVLNVCLHSRFQLAIYWGPELILLYNDAERDVMGRLHPDALGKPAREVLADIWDIVGPMLYKVLECGEATWSMDQPLMIDRYGLLEEAFFTWSYSPLPDDVGGIGGVLLVTEETTQRVLAERRLRTLQELAGETAFALNTEQTCAAAMRILGQHPADIPFALLYELDGAGSVKLSFSTGVDAGPVERFPFGDVTLHREVLQIDDLARFFPSGVAQQLPKSALILPVLGFENPAGFLVAGVSDHRRLDTAYRHFFDLVAAQIGTTIASVRARQQEQARQILEARQSAWVLLDNVINSITDCVCLKDRDLHTILCNPAFAELVGKKPLDLYGKTDFENGFVRGDPAAGFPGYEEGDRAALRGEIVHGVPERTMVHGELRFFETIKVPLYDDKGEIIGVLGTGRDVTERMRSEEKIHALTAQLINAQEEERSRLARELHDDLSQQIAALSIVFGNLKKKIRSQPEALEQSERMRQKLVQLAESTRRLSHELHPAVLEHSGLVAALGEYCSELTALTGIRVTLETGGEGCLNGLSAAVSLCVYRVVQEALQNVVRHAKVDEAHVEVRRSEGVLSLAVSDRGVGIEPNRGSALAGLGVASMKERARLVHGSLVLVSQPGQGTILTLTIPVGS